MEDKVGISVIVEIGVAHLSIRDVVKAHHRGAGIMMLRVAAEDQGIQAVGKGAAQLVHEEDVVDTVAIEIAGSDRNGSEPLDLRTEVRSKSPLRHQ